MPLMLRIVMSKNFDYSTQKLKDIQNTQKKPDIINYKSAKTDGQDDHRNETL